MKGMVNRGVVESGSVVNGGMVNGCMVDWGSMDRGSMNNRVGGCRGVDCFTRISDISNVSTISIINTVSNSLDPAVREGYVVTSRGCVSITSFSGTKVDSRVVISSGVDIVVSGGNIGVDGGSVVGRGGCIGRWARGSNGSDEGSKSNKGLKLGKKYGLYLLFDWI